MIALRSAARQALALFPLFVGCASPAADPSLDRGEPAGAPAGTSRGDEAEPDAPTYHRLVPGPSGARIERMDGPAPDLDLSALQMIEGRWIGRAFGGTVEENWNPMLGGQMLGTFRLVVNGEPAFSEHMLLAVLDGRPVLRLKHFGADLVGWEEKDDFVEFELLDVEEGRAAYFDGLTFLRERDELRIDLEMLTDGGSRVETFLFTRAVR